MNPKKKLIRTSLSKIINQFEEEGLKNFVRNHKSYIVNLENVDKVTGNSRQYNFHIKNTDIMIPVSRSFSREIIYKLQKEL